MIINMAKEQTKNYFGNNLKLLCVAQNATYRDVAEQIGVDVSQCIQNDKL